MAKAPKKGRKRNIPYDQFQKMNAFERAEATRQAGIKRGSRRASGIAGRSFYADAVESRKGESVGLRSRGSKYVSRFNDPNEIMKEGAREIESFNKRLLRERTVKGKAVYRQGGEEILKDLRSLLKQVLDESSAKNARNVARKAARAAKKLK